METYGFHHENIRFSSNVFEWHDRKNIWEHMSYLYGARVHHKDKTRVQLSLTRRITERDRRITERSLQDASITFSMFFTDGRGKGHIFASWQVDAGVHVRMSC